MTTITEEQTEAKAAIGGREAALTEARAILDRYEPEKGKGVSLAEPSQGEARRFLRCIKALLPHVGSAPASTLKTR